MIRQDKAREQAEIIRRREAERLARGRGDSTMPKNGDEFMFPPGVGGGEGRSDVYLVVDGPAPKLNMPLTLDLHLVTGSADIAITECDPADLVRLGQWLIATAGPLLGPPPAPQPIPSPVIQGA